MTIGTGKKEKLYYVWRDNDIEYQIKASGNLSNDDCLTMISSMKYPDNNIHNRYINNNMLNVRIYDTEDLRLSPEFIGFTPKFLQLLGQFKAATASVTQKVNFSYPVDDADKKTRLLSIGYQNLDNNNNGVKSFDFKQIKNGHTYEDMKMNGYDDFYRIDGQKHEVKASPMELEEIEVLKTEKYKIDGALSDPYEADFVSYFWKENDVCFQVTFKGEEPKQQEIVTYLMNEITADFNNLR